MNFTGKLLLALLLIFPAVWMADSFVSNADAVSGYIYKKASPDEEGDYKETEYLEEDLVADPIEPWNRLVFAFNDKLYFWVLKPVAKGYSAVLPEDVRGVVRNFFNNLAAPVNIVNNLLQWKPKAAGNELLRFVVNSTLGFAGLSDAAEEEFGIVPQREDFGQTLGSYGLGHGMYIVWPVIGPSSIRDTLGLVGDFFLYPVNYLSEEEAVIGIHAVEEINEISLHIGDYEDLKESALDPYISLQDAYIQYRKEKVKK